MTTTGQGAPAATRDVTDPYSSVVKPLRPREPTTTRSAPRQAASSAGPGLPSTTRPLTGPDPFISQCRTARRTTQWASARSSASARIERLGRAPGSKACTTRRSARCRPASSIAHSSAVVAAFELSMPTTILRIGTGAVSRTTTTGHGPRRLDNVRTEPDSPRAAATVSNTATTRRSAPTDSRCIASDVAARVVTVSIDIVGHRCRTAFTARSIATAP